MAATMTTILTHAVAAPPPSSSPSSRFPSRIHLQTTATAAAAAAAEAVPAASSSSSHPKPFFPSPFFSKPSRSSSATPQRAYNASPGRTPSSKALPLGTSSKSRTRASFRGSHLRLTRRRGEGLLGRASRTYTVEMEHNGGTHVLQVAEDETILSKALEAGLDVPYDCQLGVCMTCPAKLEQGQVNQSEGMLSEDVIAKGYALMCASYPLSDCRVRSIPEDELLALQLVTASD